MKKLFVSIFVMLSLLVGPLAHAAGMDCPDTGCAISGESIKEKKHGGSKLVETGHHCCCAPMLDRVGEKPAASNTFVFTAFALPEMPHLASITIDPLLQPPSQA